MTLEASIEEYLRVRVEKAGGLCIKLHPAGVRGIPDRLVILPGGERARIAFVELKRPRGGVLSTLQLYWRTLLLGMGCEHHVIAARLHVDMLVGAKDV